MSSSDQRARRLVVTKRQATALLAAVSVVWLVATIVGGRARWVGYLQATAEASMVGGLADWFAVTALFRRPLGLPIPHTAIIVERKNQFGTTLGDFVQESFLTPAAIIERVRAARVPSRAAAWLAEPDNAARLAANAADAIVTFADFLDDGEVRAAIESFVRGRIESLSPAPLAGRALRWIATGERDAELIDSALRGIDAYLLAHGHEIRARLGERPWWLPGAVEDRLLDRLLHGLHLTLIEMIGEPGHPLRRDLDAALAKVATDLMTSPELLERGERLKRDFLTRSHVADWAASTWTETKAQLRNQAATPDSELRVRLASWIQSAGTRLGADTSLQERAEDALETAATYVIGHFDGEIAGLVSQTIARWDGAETSRRLELLLGPDLQYIRINGTVVGGLAGLVLYSLSRVIG